MNDATEFVVASKEAAYQAARDCYAQAQALLLDGKRVRMTVAEEQDSLSARQRRFFHGPLLEQVSAQVCVEGRRFTRDVWKRYFKDRILERKPRYEMVRLPGYKRAVPRRQPWSTEELGVKAYSAFIDECIAIAATDFAVEFRFLVGERDAVRYQPTSSRKTRPLREAAPC
jgi:hypothetical protein